MSSVDAPVRLRFQRFAPGALCHVAERRIVAATLPPLHDHDFHEVFWIEHGTGLHVVDRVARRFGPGTLAWVAARDVHGFRADTHKGYGIVNVAFTRAVWKDLVKRCLGADGDLLDRPPAAREYRLAADALAEVRRAANDLLAGARDRFALELFLLTLLRRLRDLPPLSEPGPPAWLRRAVALVVANVEAAAHGTEVLVVEAARTHEHVAREARRWYGRTPTDIVNDARLGHAARLLTETRLPITEVAARLGVVNVSHFYRLFRRRFGVTPAAYRAAFPHGDEIVAPIARESG